MSAAFLPVFAQYLWSAVAFAGLTAAAFTASEWLVRRHARAKHAPVRVKSRPSPR